MCGIFALLNSYGTNNEKIEKQFIKGKSRGPENSTFVTSYPNITFGFHRLAINGLNADSNQPIVIDGIVLICNGEIYNYKELFKSMPSVTPSTESDCEVIIHLYLKYGFLQMLQMIDGVFAFVLYDNRDNADNKKRLYVARDSLGIRPLYYLKNLNAGYMSDNLSGFASELKCLDCFVGLNPHQYTVEQFKPGTYSLFECIKASWSEWKPALLNQVFFVPTFSYGMIIKNDGEYIDEILKTTSRILNDAVKRQCGATQRPIACLLSGGLDSSLIAALVNEHYKANDQVLETYSIGLLGSEDLKYAQIAAKYLGTKHTEIIVTEQEMFAAIPQVIYAIESYDTTTVRASIGNYLIGKYISENSEAKVIFNGDGSDELCGGYLYMHQCPDDIEFDSETRRLLNDIYMFDVLRSDKCISSHGLEPRTPFLDRTFVNHYLSIPPRFRNHKNQNAREKFLLRSSFTFPNFEDSEGKQILPNEILWRRKEAFSDGVSGHGRSLFTILQERIAKKLSISTPDIEVEKLYYKQQFAYFFSNSTNILPYYWMPKYTNATDPSARTLDIYKNKSTEKNELY
jgi:asparagine synthase (glutamine-hydrolysing)